MSDHVPEQTPEQRRAHAMRGLTVDATHVPTGDLATPDLRLRYRVTLRHDGREVLTTEYTMGIGHCPSYPKRLHSGLTVDELEAVRFECKTGRVCRNPSGPLGPIPGAPILPDPESVVWSLLLDGGAIDHPTFEDWAADFGYDPDNRKGEAVYRACLETGLKLRAALGDARLAELREAFADY